MGCSFVQGHLGATVLLGLNSLMEGQLDSAQGVLEFALRNLQNYPIHRFQIVPVAEIERSILAGLRMISCIACSQVHRQCSDSSQLHILSYIALVCCPKSYDFAFALADALLKEAKIFQVLQICNYWFATSCVGMATVHCKALAELGYLDAAAEVACIHAEATSDLERFPYLASVYSQISESIAKKDWRKVSEYCKLGLDVTSDLANVTGVLLLCRARALAKIPGEESLKSAVLDYMAVFRLRKHNREILRSEIQVVLKMLDEWKPLRNCSGEAFSRRELCAILDIPDNASPQQIRKAYFQAALDLHPDKNTGCSIEERNTKEKRFIEVKICL